MPKLYSARIIVAALRRAGFNVVSQKGSHIKLVKWEPLRTLTAIVPNHKEIARGTFSSILRQVDMERDEFEKFVK